MIQEIIALSIVAGALGYTAFSIFRIFKPKKGNEKKSFCAGCTSNGCSLSSNRN